MQCKCRCKEEPRPGSGFGRAYVLPVVAKRRGDRVSSCRRTEFNGLCAFGGVDIVKSHCRNTCSVSLACSTSDELARSHRKQGPAVSNPRRSG